MNRITVSFFGPVRKPWPESKRSLDIPKGSSVESLLVELGYKASDLKRMAAVVNGQRCSALTLLEDGDDLQFILMAGGG